MGEYDKNLATMSAGFRKKTGAAEDVTAAPTATNIYQQRADARLAKENADSGSVYDSIMKTSQTIGGMIAQPVEDAVSGAWNSVMGKKKQ
jgi:hypothetical protein